MNSFSVSAVQRRVFPASQVLRVFSVPRSALGPLQQSSPFLASSALRLAAELRASGSRGKA